MNEDRSEVEGRWEDQAEGQRTEMKEVFASAISSQCRVEDEANAFEAGEGHEEEIDDVQGVVQPDPDRTERPVGWIHLRTVQVRERERNIDGDEKEGDDEQKQNCMVVDVFAQSFAAQESQQDVEKAG